MPAAPPSGDSSAETSIPEDLRLPVAPVEAGEKIDEPASRPAEKDDSTGESHPRTVKSTPTKPKGQAAKQSAKEKGKATEEESDPPHQLDAGIDDLIRGAESEGADPLRIRTDPSVVRTQGPAPADGAPAAPARTEASGPTVDRLPIGKQSVAVTVDVQAPASMNLNQVANLKLVIRNTGTSDALNVDVEDELPEGLRFISSVPEMTKSHESHLSFKIPTLAAGSERTISVKVKPTKTGPFEHAATVKFETGCRSRTRVLEPKLKVDVVANPTTGKVLKGQPVEFKVTVTNLGDGRRGMWQSRPSSARAFATTQGPRAKIPSSTSSRFPNCCRTSRKSSTRSSPMPSLAATRVAPSPPRAMTSSSCQKTRR